MVESALKVDVFKLKGRLYTLTVLALEKTDLSAFKQALQSVYDHAPKMFAHTPVVLDLSALKGVSFDLKGLCDAMREVNMVPIGVQGTSVIQRKAAIACGLSIFTSNSKKEVDIPINISETSAKEAAPAISLKNQDAIQTDTSADKTKSVLPSTHSKVITTPVRSGQQIYAKEADLIVLSSVGRGAELLADGHIHVYGALRGRALAGINGNESARIFCTSLDAELISIAGHYMMSENQKSTHKGPQQILLKEGHLTIDAL